MNSWKVQGYSRAALTQAVNILLESGFLSEDAAHVVMYLLVRTIEMYSYPNPISIRLGNFLWKDTIRLTAKISLAPPADLDAVIRALEDLQNKELIVCADTLLHVTQDACSRPRKPEGRFLPSHLPRKKKTHSLFSLDKNGRRNHMDLDSDVYFWLDCEALMYLSRNSPAQ